MTGVVDNVAAKAASRSSVQSVCVDDDIKVKV